MRLVADITGVILQTPWGPLQVQWATLQLLQVPLGNSQKERVSRPTVGPVQMYHQGPGFGLRLPLKGTFAGVHPQGSMSLVAHGFSSKEKVLMS